MARRENHLAFFLVFFGITLFVILLGRIGVLNLFIDGVSAVSWKASGLLNVGKSQNDNAAVDKADLRKKLLDNQNLISENKALRDQFATTAIPSQNLIPAKVVGSPGFIPAVSSPDYIVIDKGKSSGLGKGNVIVYKDNLVGRIVSLGDNFSKVELIIKTPSFAVKVQASDKQIIGLAKGKGDGLVLENVLLSESLEKNQLVLTKGDLDEDGKGVPPDLVVGKIVSIEKKETSLFQKAEVKSFIDLKNLVEVFVIK